MTRGLIRPAGSVIAQNKKASNTSGSIYRFPSDLGAHAMVLNIKDYSYGGGTVENEVLSSSIVLPIPKSLEDNFSIKLETPELGIAGAGVADAVSGAVTPGKLAEYAKALGSNTISGLNAEVNGSDMLTAARFFSRAGLGAIAPDIGSGIDAATGTIVNPHTTLVFDGVGMKTFSFNWSLSPKNSDESGMLRDIINELKAAALPRYASPFKGVTTGTSIDRGLMRYPSMVDIFFVGLDQSYFFFFKTCMIGQIQVDYTPNGVSLYRGENGARPTFVNMSLSFTESSIHTRGDYVMEEESDVTTTFIGPQ